jgi:hypothetical protein
MDRTDVPHDTVANVVPSRFYSMRFTEAPPSSPQLDGGHTRRFRVSVVGTYRFESTAVAPAAVEHARQVLEQIFEQYGVELGVSGVEILGVLD